MAETQTLPMKESHWSMEPQFGQRLYMSYATTTTNAPPPVPAHGTNHGSLTTKMAIEVSVGTRAVSEGLFANIAGFLALHVTLIIGVLTISANGSLSCGYWPIPLLLYVSVSFGIVGAAQWRFRRHCRLLDTEERVAVRELTFLLVIYYGATSMFVLIASSFILCHWRN